MVKGTSLGCEETIPTIIYHFKICGHTVILIEIDLNIRCAEICGDFITGKYVGK
jgi:hypothetical protein